MSFLEHLRQFGAAISVLDWFTLACFIVCWVTYTLYAKHQGRVSRSLFRGTNHLREVWMERLLEREVRIMDTALLAALMQSVSFFASTTIIIIGGLIAALGAVDHTVQIAANLGVLVDVGREAWTLKLLTLVAVFVYAFFKLTWALRQFNRCAILIGAAPPHDQLEASTRRLWVRRAWAKRLGRLNALAGNDFNHGLRAYYFGLAVLAWFIHPWFFLAALLGVLIVLYRREFSSEAVALLFDEEEGASSPDL